MLRARNLGLEIVAIHPDSEETRYRSTERFAGRFAGSAEKMKAAFAQQHAYELDVTDMG
jgi:hypothetical protein